MIDINAVLEGIWEKYYKIKEGENKYECEYKGIYKNMQENTSDKF